METSEALIQIFSNLPFGSDYSLTSDTLKDMVRNMTGHYPSKNEFREAMDSIRTPHNPLGIATGKGYFRVRAGSPDYWKFFKRTKRHCDKQISTTSIPV